MSVIERAFGGTKARSDFRRVLLGQLLRASRFLAVEKFVLASARRARRDRVVRRRRLLKQLEDSFRHWLLAENLVLRAERHAVDKFLSGPEHPKTPRKDEEEIGSQNCVTLGTQEPLGIARRYWRH